MDRKKTDYVIDDKLEWITFWYKARRRRGEDLRGGGTLAGGMLTRLLVWCMLERVVTLLCPKILWVCGWRSFTGSR